MEMVNFLASFWGFSLIVICLSLLIKPRQIENVFIVMGNMVVLWWLGILTIMLGIACLLAYHTWDRTWGTAITIINWLVVIKGSFYLFMPEMTQKIMAKYKNQYIIWLPTMLVAGVIFGCALVYLGTL